MSGFDRPVVLTVADSGTSFQLVLERTYTGSQGDSWTIPAGYLTDFASIPAAVSWAIPKLGAYSLAAIVHDLLCTGLNDWSEAGGRPTGSVTAIRRNGSWVNRPTASAVDTDAIFRKVAKEYGTDRVTATLLWVGVRWGALANPARRSGWLRTAPAVLGWSLLLSPVLVPATVLAVVGRAVLGLARRVLR